MQITEMAVDKLIPYARNPRKNDHAIDRMASAILEFGFRVPVLAKSNGQVIDGHLRIKAAKKLALETVPVIICDDLSDVKIKALRLNINRMAELATWDDELLKLELGELKEMEFDLELLGFDDLDDLLSDSPGGTEGNTDPDDIPEVPQNIHGVARGDIWQLGEHRLLCGDSTSKDDVEKLMNGEKADMVFTDPPYGINAVALDDGRVGGRGTIAKAGKYKPIIGDNEEFDVAYLLTYAPITFIFGGNYFAHKLPRSTHWLVWNKRSNSDREREFDTSDCELIWTNVPRRTDVPSYTHVWAGMFRAGSKKDEGKQRVHPTQKPVGLLAEIIGSYEYNSVIDLFLGSGSTLIACEKTGRKCFGCEIDEHYCSVIIERWQNFTGKQAVKLNA